MSYHINSIAKTEAVLYDLNTIAQLSLPVNKGLGRTDLGFSLFIHFASEC